MGTVKQTNVKNRTYCFYNDMIDIKTFDSDLLKIDKKSYKDIGIYNIGYIIIKKIDDYESIYSVNPLYLTINHASGYIECNSVEEKGINKYLIFNSTDENKELCKKYNDVFSKIENKVKKINVNECDYEKDDVFSKIKNKIKKINVDECDYEKDYMKIKLNSDDDLPLNKQLKFHNVIITIRSYDKNGKLYPQVFLDDTLYELNV